MKVLVTGGAGYLGSVLVPRLRADGHSVAIADTRWPSCVNVRNLSSMGPLIAQADAIIPLAGLVGEPKCKDSPREAMSVNEGAIVELLGSLRPDQKIVFPATDSGYPSGNVDEDSPMEPRSLYARTKYEAEKAVLAHGGVSLRLASVFGVSPQMRDDLMVNYFVREAVKGNVIELYEGNYRRNFVAIRDVCDAFRLALVHYEAMRGQAYNVGNRAAAMSKSDLCHLIRCRVPEFRWSEAQDRNDPDRRDNVVSTKKLETVTGWKARTSVMHGVFELIAYYCFEAVRAA